MYANVLGNHKVLGRTLRIDKKHVRIHRLVVAYARDVHTVRAKQRLAFKNAPIWFGTTVTNVFFIRNPQSFNFKIPSKFLQFINRLAGHMLGRKLRAAHILANFLNSPSALFSISQHILRPKAAAFFRLSFRSLFLPVLYHTQKRKQSFPTAFSFLHKAYFFILTGTNQPPQPNVLSLSPS